MVQLNWYACDLIYLVFSWTTSYYFFLTIFKVFWSLVTWQVVLLLTQENARKKELDAPYLMEKLFITLHLYNSYVLLVIFPWKNVTKKLSYLQTIIITSPYYFESADTFDWKPYLLCWSFIMIFILLSKPVFRVKNIQSSIIEIPLLFDPIQYFRFSIYNDKFDNNTKDNELTVLWSGLVQSYLVPIHQILKNL